MKSGFEKIVAIYAVFIVMTLAALHACAPPTAPAGGSPTSPPDDAAVVTASPCAYIGGHTEDEVATSCVSPDEAAQMGAFVLARRDAGRGSTPCSVIPFTQICATDNETVLAIDFIDAQRTQMLRRASPASSTSSSTAPLAVPPTSSRRTTPK